MSGPKVIFPGDNVVLLPTSMREKYRIKFENNTCEVDGRTFSSEHVVLSSPFKVKISMNEETVKMEAEYSRCLE